jgi:glutaredoxin-like protein
VVWAKTDEGVKGFIVEKDMPGFTAQEIENKFSLRASVTAALFFDNVRLPESSVLPGVTGLKGPLSCLTQARKPDQIAILTRDGCQYCTQAKALLEDRGFDFVEIPLAHKVRGKALGAIAGAQTAPQVFVNGERIGGLEELKRWAARAA